MEWPGLVGFLLLIADVYAVLKISESASGDGKKALWIAIVILFPYVGVVAWYLIGPRRR